jgi:hypothetical protein
MSASFPLVQDAEAVNSSSITFGSASTAGDLIVLLWAAGTSFGGNPTAPTSVTDNNGNTYVLLSASISGQPPQATCALYAALNIAIAPHNPITISTSGATGVPTGGPSLIALEFGVPAAYQVYGANCSGTAYDATQTVVEFDVALLSSIGTEQQVFALAPSGGTPGAQVACLLINPLSDMLGILALYDYSSSSLTWSASSGASVITQTAETESGTSGRTAAIATLPITFTSDACGYSDLSLSCNNPPNGSVGLAYTHTLSFGGGVPPYTFSITAGSLPAGLSLDDSTGVISGTPTTAGSSWFTVQVEDSDGDTATVTCSIGICGGGGMGNYGWTG